MTLDAINYSSQIAKPQVIYSRILGLRVSFNRWVNEAVLVISTGHLRLSSLWSYILEYFGMRGPTNKLFFCGCGVPLTRFFKIVNSKAFLSHKTGHRWCLLTTPGLALSQEEALQMQSLWSGSCRRNT